MSGEEGFYRGGECPDIVGDVLQVRMTLIVH